MHGWVITSHSFKWMQLIIHALIVIPVKLISFDLLVTQLWNEIFITHNKIILELGVDLCVEFKNICYVEGSISNKVSHSSNVEVSALSMKL